MSKINLIYIGRVEGKTGIIHKYLKTVTKEPMLFKRKIGLFCIGHIIECELTESGVKGPYLQVGYEQDSDEIRKWNNRDKAVFDEHQLNLAIRKPMHNKQNEAIQMLKKSYRELSSAQKLTFINRLIYEIVKQ